MVEHVLTMFIADAWILDWGWRRG